MPKFPITRAHVDRVGHAAAALGRATARIGGQAIRSAGRILQTVPPAVRGFAIAAVVMLLGLVGAISQRNTVGLVCTALVIPVCATILGVLGHRWYRGVGTADESPVPIESTGPSANELQRSMEYVDKKLAVALTTLGTDRHEQAVVALFQAKTAVELTLRTEQEGHDYDMALRADDYGLSPRVRGGSNPASVLREGNSLAAS